MGNRPPIPSTPILIATASLAGLALALAAPGGIPATTVLRLLPYLLASGLCLGLNPAPLPGSRRGGMRLVAASLALLGGASAALVDLAAGTVPAAGWPGLVLAGGHVALSLTLALVALADGLVRLAPPPQSKPRADPRARTQAA